MSDASLPPSGLESEPARQRVRARLMAEIPPRYNPWLHLACTTGIGVALLVLGALEIHRVRGVELLVIPAVFVLANGFEWRAHRDVLHRIKKPFEVLYRKHTPGHHVVYVEHDMAIREWRELRLVLIPAAGVLTIVVALAPFAALMGFALTPNTGWLVLLSGGLYMVGYELSHLSYHLPPESFVGRLALVRVLRRHHGRHHDPRLMQRWNFNVTIPLFDWLHGTIAARTPDVSHEGQGVATRAPERSQASSR
ncbi:MAG: sterol desaturase family protein [Polyangiaceae bacterium]